MKNFHDIGKEELLVIKVWLEGHIKISNDHIRDYQDLVGEAIANYRLINRMASGQGRKAYEEKQALEKALHILKEQLKDDYGWVEEDGDS